MAYDQQLADALRREKQWRGIADALALVLRKNGVGGRQWQSAMDLYEQASGNQACGECLGCKNGGVCTWPKGTFSEKVG